MYGYVIFTDLEKYSSLKDEDLKIYYDKIIPVIYRELKVYKDSAVVWNTWGDAIVAAYEKGENAINMALAYRDLLNNLDFEKFGIRKLNPRIAGHFGEFEILFDAVSGKLNIHGTNVNLAARIEPSTLPNEIFVSKDFKDMVCAGFNLVESVRFDDMGIVRLAKNSGEMHLFRLCKKSDEPISPVGKSSLAFGSAGESKPSFTPKNRSGFKR